MAGGLRLFHPTARSATATISVNSRPYPVPYLCPMCGKGHLVKTYHIQVNAEGFAFISREVWKVLVERGATAGFQLANDVSNPPSQFVGTGGQYTADNHGRIIALHTKGTPLVPLQE